jgi:hypothetical protein
MAMVHGTTRIREDMGLREGSMDHTAGLASVRATTQVPARMLVGLLHMDRTERVAPPKLTTPGPEPTPRRDRVPVSMEVGDRQTCNAGMIG